MNMINSTNFIFKSPTLISAFSWFCIEQSWVMVLCAWNWFYDSHLVLAHASRKHQDKTCKEIFFERWKESLPKKTRVLHEEVAQKEDRKELEQIYMSFPKMCSSLDPLVYLEMLGRAAAQQERTALAQPVVALSCLEMWHLWASLSQQLHCVLWGGKRRNFINFQRVSILLARQCESISLYNKLAVPAITN